MTNCATRRWQASYEAARIAAARRQEMLEPIGVSRRRRCFSHPSKLSVIEEAQARGFLVVVMHVGVDSPDLSVARVRARNDEGGHDVPEDKIRARYDRGAPLIRAAVKRADRGMVFDNSGLNTPPRQMLVFARGRLTRAEPILPDWILRTYAPDLLI